MTVGLVALPLAMAFAISSGLRPEAGIYTAIVAGFISSLLGGTRTQVSGPTGAFVVVVFGIVAQHGVDGLYVVTFLAGLMLVLLGGTGLGTAVKFIPRPVVVGFTNGIAVLIASTQLKDFFGLHADKVPGDFVGRMATLWGARSTLDGATLIVGAVALTALIVFARYVNRVPGAIVVLFGVTAAAVLLHLHIETVGSRFGGIPQGLPRLQFPKPQLSLIPGLIGPAITVAMLGAIESLMSAVVADRMTRDRHNPNVELIAQGIANIFTPMVGGLPSTGAIARTATNIRSGAKTPLAGIIHALTLLTILLVAAPLAAKIPLAVLAAILLMVAYNMGEWGEIPEILRLSKADAAVWALTFLLTVFADLTFAVQAGMILAALLYISRVTKTTTVGEVTDEEMHEGRDHVMQFHEVPNGVVIFRIHGPFLFGSTDKVYEMVERLPELPPVVVLRLRNMTAIDATGVQAIEGVVERVRESGREVILCGMREQPGEILMKAGIAEVVGAENLCPNVSAAMARARHLLSVRSALQPSAAIEDPERGAR